LYGLEDEWIFCPPGVLGDQLAVHSFATVMLQVGLSPDGLQTGIRWFPSGTAIRLPYDPYRQLRYP
jgi:hypothetical protein